MSDNQVKKRFDKLAMVFLIIPRGGLYSLLMVCAIALLWLDIIPGSIFAVIGLVRAARAKMTGFFVLGLIEVSGVVLLLLMCAYIVFVGGQGV